ncbi:hypothetical protein PC358_01515 [Pseudomonas capeferrum]|nr:hypothetical protein PC358_01515 [Pseudomonas capeferrum]
MVSYPIYVTRNSYRGNDIKKRAKASQDNQDAARIEEACNRLIQNQTQPIQSYLWMEVSRESGVDYETVRRLGYSIDGGSNGFTATKPGLSQE